MIITILLIIIASGATYLLMQDNNEKNNIQNNIPDNQEKDNDKTNNEDKIDINIVKELHNSLLTESHTHGLYPLNKVTINDANDKDLIIFNIKNYLIENNINYLKNNIENNPEDYVMLYEINKTNFNDYMHKKYNTKTNYDLPIAADNDEGYNFENTIELFSKDNQWTLMNIPKSGGNNYIEHKLLNYKAEGNELYIFDKMIACSESAGSSICSSIIADSNEGLVIDCSSDSEGNLSASCPLKNDYTLAGLASYGLNQLSGKLNTYKHTFKKNNEGYYWYSTEVVEEN